LQVRTSLLFSTLDARALQAHQDCVQDQEALRGMLRAAGLVAFVVEGALLPRCSGNSDKPMQATGDGAGGDGGAVRFVPPASMRMAFTLPNRGPVSGMAVRRGVTVIVGGGFHGKTTLLKALEVGGRVQHSLRSTH
jgi:predicted ABC-class ATPase